MRYVILGNGAAGISAAETLRSLDELSKITIISEENVPTYTKFLLPDYVGGRLTREKLFTKHKNYEDNKINLMLNKNLMKLM